MHKPKLLFVCITTALLLSGCFASYNESTDNTEQPTTTPPTDNGTTGTIIDLIDNDASFSAVIERTSYGTAHITALDYQSLGFGQGYAFAQDRYCVLMDQIVKVKGERSKYFGPDSTPDDGHIDNINIATDFGYKSLQLEQKAPQAISELSDNGQAMLNGYLNGFNHYLAVTGVDNLSGDCSGANWVREITIEELVAYYFDVAMLAGTRNFITAIGATAPPQSPELEVKTTINIPKGMASNGIALGEEMTTDAQAMMLSNTHLPWEGELKYHEVHLTIPNELDVAGVSLSGIFGVLIGFNQNIAWTHTTSPSNQFLLYQLSLDQNDHTHYWLDGVSQPMNQVPVTIEINTGSELIEQTQNYYHSQHGPIVRADSMGLVWNEQTAFALKDVNGSDLGFLDMFLAKAKAQNIEQVTSLYQEVSGVPWNHSMIADVNGQVMYADATMVPNIDNTNPLLVLGGLTALQAVQANLAINPTAKAAFEQGLLIVDGSNSIFSLTDSPTASKAGIVPFDNAPQLTRSDFVANSNDNFWLSNPNAPIDANAHSFLYGSSNTVRSMRTRMGLTQIAERDSYTSTDLQQLLFANRSLTADMFKTTLVELCHDHPVVPNSQGINTNVTEACEILDLWDGRYNVNSVGAIVFRQTLSGLVNNQGLLDDSWYQTPFDPNDPVATPNGLTLAGKEGILIGLADAVTFINATTIADSNGEDLFTLDAPLGQLQFTIKGEQKIPVHGGLPDTDGIFNKVESKQFGIGTLSTSLLPGSNVDLALDPATDLSSNGYHINYGSSYIMTVALTEDGPQAQAMLSYSQSDDSNSSHNSDQTLLYSNKLWRAVLFNRDEILTDDSYQVEMIAK